MKLNKNALTDESQRRTYILDGVNRFQNIHGFCKIMNNIISTVSKGIDNIKRGFCTLRSPDFIIFNINIVLYFEVQLCALCIYTFKMQKQNWMLPACWILQKLSKVEACHVAYRPTG